MDFRTRDSCMALSMKSMLSIHSRKISMTMKHLVLFASLSHVAQCLWCRHGMFVHLVGPKSTMGTWWVDTTTTRKDTSSSVSTKMQSMPLVPRVTRMVPFSTPYKGNVAHSRATHISLEESWHALCALSDRRRPFHWKCKRRPKIKFWTCDFFSSLDLTWRKTVSLS